MRAFWIPCLACPPFQSRPPSISAISLASLFFLPPLTPILLCRLSPPIRHRCPARAPPLLSSSPFLPLQLCPSTPLSSLSSVPFHCLTLACFLSSASSVSSPPPLPLLSTPQPLFHLTLLFSQIYTATLVLAPLFHLNLLFSQIYTVVGAIHSLSCSPCAATHCHWQHYWSLQKIQHTVVLEVLQVRRPCKLLYLDKNICSFLITKCCTLNYHIRTS
jgi:hypothetical protein